MLIFKEPTTHTFSDLKLAFLTGLSEPKSCNLSAIQSNFLTRLSTPKASKVYLNFPYLSSSLTSREAFKEPPLWRASLENSKQFFVASQSNYKTAATRHLEALAASCNKLILLLGSCGLEILNHALSPSVQAKLEHVFVFGPVARRKPVVPYTFIQGSHDLISRFFFKDAHVLVSGVGHMNYLENELVFEAVNEKLGSLLKQSNSSLLPHSDT